MELLERRCAFCRREIGIGEAWMLSEHDGSERVAHSGCVNSEQMDPDERASRMPP
jgi:hypothetical protein